MRQVRDLLDDHFNRRGEESGGMLAIVVQDSIAKALLHLDLNRMHLASFFDDLPLVEKLASELCHPIEFWPVPWLATRLFI
jgi:hypothetical protein